MLDILIKFVVISGLEGCEPQTDCFFKRTQEQDSAQTGPMSVG